MTLAADARTNRLLAALPAPDWQRRAPMLEPAEPPLGHVLYESAPVLQLLLLRYTQALITQMAQTAVCNRHHALDQQLCRWPLLSRDRLQGDELILTQEPIANMLGVRREGVTTAAHRLQQAGVIEYARGHRSHPPARPGAPGAAHLRVLCGRREGIRPAAAARPARLTLRRGRRDEMAPNVRQRTETCARCA